MKEIVRVPTPEDAPRLAELLNEYSRRLFGEADLDEQEVRHWFSLPGIWIGVVERDGRPVAYVDTADEDDQGTRFHIDARPLDEAAAAVAVGAAEQYARSRARNSAILRGYAPDVDAAARAAYERAGFRVVRHSFEMRIDLTELAEPEWPGGIAVRTYRPVDEDSVWKATNDAFADHWDHQPPTAEGRDQWRKFNLENPRFDPTLWFLAEDGDELAGVCLCMWHQSGDPGFGWVQTLGVRRPWRRRGLALALLRHSFADFARRGAARVGLGVDAQNLTGAVRLYERAGMHVARRSDIWEKPL